MAASKIELTLIPAPDDPPLRSSGYQKELHRFMGSLNAEGVKYGFGLDLIEAAPADGSAPIIYTGVFTLAKASWPVIAGFIVAWLRGRSKRKVRIVISPRGVSAEAQTTEQVERLVKTATEYQQTMREIEKPKVKERPPSSTKKASTKKQKKPR